MAKKSAHPKTPLAQLITARLQELGLKQVDFCRQTGFDQGLLSKLQTCVITTINMESALRLADGLQVHPGAILTLLGKGDAHILLKKLYGNDVCAQCAGENITPEQVHWITSAATRAFKLGRDVSPVLTLLQQLTTARRSHADAERLVAGGHS